MAGKEGEVEAKPTPQQSIPSISVGTELKRCFSRTRDLCEFSRLSEQKPEAQQPLSHKRRMVVWSLDLD
jgi:hypothetical protein